jgi:hypothetical protein
MGELLGGPWAADVTEVAGAPDTALHVLGAGVLQLVLVPRFRWASQRISTCRSQYHWSTFCTKHFHSLNAAGSSTSASESLMQIGEHLLQLVVECAVSPVDLARQHVNKEISKLLVGLHMEPIKFHFRSGFRIWISKHLFNEVWPIMQPTRGDEIDFIFIFELCVEVVLGRPTQVG